MISIEPYEMYCVVTGSLRLDGGAMFGVVPKVLWRDKVDDDDDNRILLATRTLLAVDRSAGRVVVVETGCGSKWDNELAERFAIQFDPQAIDRALQTLDLTRDDVTDVVITHLHFDHNGGLTEWVDRRGGPTRLVFGKACHWVHRKHWEHAHDASPKDRASFMREDFAVLEDSPLLTLIEGDDPECPLDGIEWFVSNGHTPCQLHPIFGSGPKRLMFLGDIVPTVNHLPTAWVMAYDLYPLTTMAEKESIYKRCRDEELLLAFPHDPKCAGVSVDTSAGRAIVKETLNLE